jgi:WhiB family redox-sensing transcriptional regulator
MTTLDVLNIVAPPEWMAEGLCAQVDPELFYPDKGGSTREAKQVCAGCPVLAECLAYALVNGERFGVWGGTSERERRRIKHRATRTEEPRGPGLAGEVEAA